MRYIASHTAPNLKIPPMPSAPKPSQPARSWAQMAEDEGYTQGVPRGTTDYGKPFSKANPGELKLASETHLKNITAYLTENPWSTYKQMQASVGVHNKSIHNYMRGYIDAGLIVRNGRNQYNLPEAPQ